jgi:hypothetical protein
MMDGHDNGIDHHPSGKQKKTHHADDSLRPGTELGHGEEPFGRGFSIDCDQDEIYQSKNSGVPPPGPQSELNLR